MLLPQYSLVGTYTIAAAAATATTTTTCNQILSQSLRTHHHGVRRFLTTRHRLFYNNNNNNNSRRFGVGTTITSTALASLPQQDDDGLRITSGSVGGRRPQPRPQSNPFHQSSFSSFSSFTSSSLLTTTTTTTTTTRRWMGSKVGSGGPPGEIQVMNEQDDLPDIQVNKLYDTLYQIRHILGYETYDLNLFLINDEEMIDTNRNTRNINDTTDILSFGMHPSIRPGILEEPPFNFPHYYVLGEILIDVPYVMRQCQEDQEEDQEKKSNNVEGVGVDGTNEQPKDNDNKDDDNNNDNNNDDNDDTMEEEQFVYDDRGVSAAMAKVFDTEMRLHMLLIHGMLHLYGYDHETDHDYKVMVEQEEKLLIQLGLPTATNPPQQQGTIVL